MRSDEAADLVIEHLAFRHFYLVLHLFVLVKSVQQRLVDRLVHPVFGLLCTMSVKITVLLREGDVLFYVLPYFHHTGMIDGGAADGFGLPSGFGRWEEHQCVLETHTRGACAFNIITVAFIDGDTVRHLHDTAFDAL